jgi:hypothetical protein
MYKINIFGGRTFCISFFLPDNIVVDVFIMWHRQPSRVFYLIKKIILAIFLQFTSIHPCHALVKSHLLYIIRDTNIEYDKYLYLMPLFLVKKCSRIYFFHVYLFTSLHFSSSLYLSKVFGCSGACSAEIRTEDLLRHGRCNNQ